MKSYELPSKAALSYVLVFIFIRLNASEIVTEVQPIKSACKLVVS